MTKPETRIKPEARNPKEASRLASAFGFRIWFGFRVSPFGFHSQVRHSKFELKKKNPSAVAGKGSRCFGAQVGARAKTVEVKIRLRNRTSRRVAFASHRGRAPSSQERLHRTRPPGGTFWSHAPGLRTRLVEVTSSSRSSSSSSWKTS